MALVQFFSTTAAKYAALETKNSDTLYFVEDMKKIYKGSVDMTSDVVAVTAFNATVTTEVPEKIYINPTSGEVRIVNNGAWVVLNPGYVDNKTDFAVAANSGKFSTIAGIKGYVDDEIASITGGTKFVQDIAWDNTNGELQIDKGAETTTDVELTGVAHDPTYGNLVLTIPIYGQNDLVVNIPKDNFVRSGRYEADYPLPGGGTGPAVVLVVGDGDTTSEVVIPAASFVDIYTGGTTDNISVSVSENNVITATAIIDPAANNALVSSATGLMVNVDDKANKLASTTDTHVLVSDGGDLGDSGITIKDPASAEMGNSSSELVTANLIAAAIAAAVQAAQSTLQDEVDALDDRVTELETNLAIGTGDANKVIISTASGITRSTATIGGATLTNTSNSLATEEAVYAALSWQTLA